jgi:hypothetical protein
MASYSVDICASWDEEARVWTAASEPNAQLWALVCEADTLEALYEKIGALVIDMAAPYDYVRWNLIVPGASLKVAVQGTTSRTGTEP